jgi:multiple sugar transport system substrate-binding protein
MSGHQFLRREILRAMGIGGAAAAALPVLSACGVGGGFEAR